jgi:hypothetical protein
MEFAADWPTAQFSFISGAEGIFLDAIFVPLLDLTYPIIVTLLP